MLDADLLTFSDSQDDPIFEGNETPWLAGKSDAISSERQEIARQLTQPDVFHDTGALSERYFQLTLMRLRERDIANLRLKIKDSILKNVRQIEQSASRRHEQQDSAVRAREPSKAFHVSDRTIGLVRGGLRFAASNSNPARDVRIDSDDIDYLRDDHIEDFCDSRLRRILAVVADRKEVAGIRSPILSDSGRFSNEIDVYLLEDFPFVPKEFALLSDSIYKDVFDYVFRGGHLGGVWGNVAISSGLLYLAIQYNKPRRKRSQPTHVNAVIG